MRGMGLRDDPERLIRIGLEGLMRVSECADEQVAAQAREMLSEYRERLELLALWLKESPEEARDAALFQLWLACLPEEKIAEQVGMKQGGRR